MLTATWNWITSNSAALGTLLAAAPIAWAVVQFIISKRAEAKRTRFETYHSLIKQLVQSDDPAHSIRLDRQVAVVFELRNFKHYYPVTLRILQGLKHTWTYPNSVADDKNGRLLREIELTIEHISKNV